MLRNHKIENTGYTQNKQSSISLFDEIHAVFPFEPKPKINIRRTSSMDDISRFYRYFHLVQENLGNFFTWKKYLEILQNQLGSLETQTIPGKGTLPFIQQNTESKVTFPVSDARIFERNKESSTNPPPLSEDVESSPILEKYGIFFQNEKVPEARTTLFGLSECRQPSEENKLATITSGAQSLSTTTKVMMKNCSESNNLAQKINQTAEIISRLPPTCSDCSLEGWNNGQRKTGNEKMEMAEHVTGDLNDMILEDDMGAKRTDFSTTSIFLHPNFSVSNSGAGGEATVVTLKTEDAPLPKKSSLRNIPKKNCLNILAQLCGQFRARK